MKSVLITGASRGIRHGFASAFADAGWRVYGAARNPESEGIQKLQQQFPERFTPVRMDVTDGTSIAIFSVRT